MDIQTFEDISLTIGISILVLYMGYIIWDLAKKSDAGKFGTAALFIVLGLGVMGFVLKAVIMEYMNY